ncbi:hypothetical protein [Streptomyces sp. V4I2]|uniref:hypothetical protein n=1 Tax=Streptomyces sp. V4I2 TaxID=3042280 RepID=UPI002785F8ED|nr:hypothetical protein [Streptomyces sp. V4I2]MDQ1051458.1 hypothetical protein [Streptomyces sp. V4I2]
MGCLTALLGGTARTAILSGGDLEQPPPNSLLDESLIVAEPQQAIAYGGRAEVPADWSTTFVEGDRLLRPTFPVQVLLVILSLVSALLVAVVAGVLSHAAGVQAAGAVLYSGSAFTAWMTLCVTVLTALGLLGAPGESGHPHSPGE